MGSREYFCDADRFGRTMEQLLGDISDEVKRGMAPAVKEAAKVGRAEVKAKAPYRTGAYQKGWSYRMKKSGDEVTAEIGNKDLPGLPHLLEKGHAKVGGGRVGPSPEKGHIAPAADEAFKELQEQVERVVDSL